MRAAIEAALSTWPRARLEELLARLSSRQLRDVAEAAIADEVAGVEIERRAGEDIARTASFMASTAEREGVLEALVYGVSCVWAHERTFRLPHARKLAWIEDVALRGAQLPARAS